MRKVILALGLVAAAAAQSKPDFSGTWKLLSRNDAPAKDSFVTIIQQKGDHLHYRIDRDKVERQTDVDLTIAGEPHESDRYGIIEAKWQGDVLVVSFLYNPGTPREAEQVTRWKLSEDGKQVVDDTTVRRANEKEVHVKRIFARQ